MRVRDGFELKEIADSYIVIPVKENVVDFSSVIMLNETSAFLWMHLVDDTDEDKLVNALLVEYDVDEKTAREDVKKFLSELEGAGVLEVE